MDIFDAYCSISHPEVCFCMMFSGDCLKKNFIYREILKFMFQLLTQISGLLVLQSTECPCQQNNTSKFKKKKRKRHIIGMERETR